MRTVSMEEMVAKLDVWRQMLRKTVSNISIRSIGNLRKLFIMSLLVWKSLPKLSV